jgi:hypothetical protein
VTAEVSLGGSDRPLSRALLATGICERLGPADIQAFFDRSARSSLGLGLCRRSTATS